MCLIASCSEASPQSLADLAAQEKKRREGVEGERTASYSNTDLGDGIGWRPFTPVDGHFVVDLPGKPSRTTETEAAYAGYGPIRRVSYSARDRDGKEYIVAHVDYPGALVRRAPDLPARAFAQSGPARYGSRGDSFVVRSVPIAGRPAVLYWSRTAQVAGVGVGSRFYELCVKAAPGTYFDKDTHPFFFTFRPDRP